MGILAVLILINAAAVCLSRRTQISSAVCSAMILFGRLDIIYFGALADKLKLSAALCLLMLLGYVIYAVIREGISEIPRMFADNLDIHSTLKLISMGAFGAIYLIKQPLLYYWDEIKIWGSTAAAVKFHDRLYSIGINYSNSDRNYPPGNALLNYLLTFLEKDYREVWLLMAYAFLFFASYALVSATVEKLTGSRGLGAAAYVFLLLAPFTATYHTIARDYTSISYAYATTMVDYNLAVVFLRVLALYLYDRDRPFFALPLIYLITIKKSGIFFAILAVLVILCFEVFSDIERKNRVLKTAVTAAVGIAVVFAAYGGFNLHLDHYRVRRREQMFDLTEEYEMDDVIFEETAREEEPEEGAEGELEDIASESRASKRSQTSIKSIFIPSLRTERYREILREMREYFATNRETIIGRDPVLVIFLIAVGILTAFLCGSDNRLALLVITLGLAAGCYVYGLVISYQMQFYNDQMVEYPRYMLSYYYGWIFTAFLTGMGLAKNSSRIKTAVCLAISLFVLSRLYFNTGLDRTVIESPDNVYEYQATIIEKLDSLPDVLEKGDRVYLVYHDGDGQLFNTIKYRLQPARVSIDTMNTGVDFTIGFRKHHDYNWDKYYFNLADNKKFKQVMQYYFDYILVAEPDGEFVNDYKKLFSDGISDWTLYRVTEEKVPMQKVERVDSDG